ncbi:uncharacterized protein LOC106081541 [Stomoxys calcitrans]|uniref:Uncharacterized protein n=1 Tax=Stomoxys calcitrans TaxID=35570 RepID=A0A1I8NLR3_STOCA|nr:uncharacterized protein LOC106081541 [Stomoxys calcitrans]
MRFFITLFVCLAVALVQAQPLVEEPATTSTPLAEDSEFSQENSLDPELVESIFSQLLRRLLGLTSQEASSALSTEDSESSTDYPLGSKSVSVGLFQLLLRLFRQSAQVASDAAVVEPVGFGFSIRF